MKRTIAVICAVVVFTALCICFYSVRATDTFGHVFTLDKKEITFEGYEITDTNTLIAKLKEFGHLTKVDLGNYMVHADDKERLDNSFPDTVLIYDTYINMYGDRFDTKITDLDLSGYDISNLDDLKIGLPYLSQVKKVRCDDCTITHEELKSLEDSFPDVEFDIVSTYTIYGETFRDDITELDLTNITTDKKLIRYLEYFPMLKSVDLHGKELTTEEQLEFVERYPNIKFGWEVDVAGTFFDSSVEELDLSDSWWIDNDTIRTVLPLFHSLKFLDLSDCGLDNEEMAKLRDDFPDTEIVWMLHMGRWYLKTNAITFSVLIYDYKHKRLTSNDIEVLKYCTNLQALDIGHQAVSDISVIGDYLKDLRILILADNIVSDLSPLSKLKHLHYLEFFVNQVTDLTPLAKCKELVDLNISYNYRINDITPLLHLPLLERLWLESTSVSEADVALLRETYPDATVINHGDGSVDQGWRWHDRYFAMIDMYRNNYMSDLFTMYDQN